MDAFERIPVDVRWKLAARELSALPLAYRRAIRDGADDQLYNEVERVVWQELGKEVGVIARAFGMPVGNAHEVAEAFAAATRVLFGPDYQYEIRDSGPDEVDLTIRKCAMVERAEEAGENPLAACNVCHAFANAAIPDLNRNYVPKYRSSICAGESACSVAVRPASRK
jgi:predicted ArsR family transcriptional regulator